MIRSELSECPRCAKHCNKLLRVLHVGEPSQQPYHPQFIDEEEGSERLSNLFEVAQLPRDRAGTERQVRALLTPGEVAYSNLSVSG